MHCEVIIIHICPASFLWRLESTL